MNKMYRCIRMVFPENENGSEPNTEICESWVLTTMQLIYGRKSQKSVLVYDKQPCHRKSPLQQEAGEGWIS